MVGTDLFDDSNKFYKEAVDNPLKIIEPLGRNFFRDRDFNNNKRSGNNMISAFDRGPGKHGSNTNNNMASGNASESRNNDARNTLNNGMSGNTTNRKKNAKNISFILSDKDKQLEQITYNKVSQRQVDMKFLDGIRPDIPTTAIQIISDADFKQSYPLFDAAEFKNQSNQILQQITIPSCENLKFLRCQNLLKILTGFVKKNSQVSQFYHVYGTFENISYIEYLKNEVELTLTTSIMKLWLQDTPKMPRITAAARYSDIETYLAVTQPVDISDANSVRTYISNLKDQATEDDFSWEGFDLYMGLRSCKEVNGYMAQERECQKKLIFDLAMVCSTLGENQNCVIKFYNVFTCKTLCILYLFFKVFQTTVMCKPRTSSLSSNQRFLICMGLKIEPARKLGQTLLDKYQEFIQEDTLPFEVRLMTQDQKFSSNFIDKFLRNVVKLQIDFFDSEEVIQKKYTDIVKVEWQRVFSQQYYKDIVDTFVIEDLKLKRDLGLKQMNLTEAFNQIENEAKEMEKVLAMNGNGNGGNSSEGQQSHNNGSPQRKNTPQFSDEEEEEDQADPNQDKSGFMHQFIANQQMKEEEEKKNKQLGNTNKTNKRELKNNVVKDPTIINQIDDRDLTYTKDLMKSIVQLPPMLMRKKK